MAFTSYLDEGRNKNVFDGFSKESSALLFDSRQTTELSLSLKKQPQGISKWVNEKGSKI